MNNQGNPFTILLGDKNATDAQRRERLAEVTEFINSSDGTNLSRAGIIRLLIDKSWEQTPR